MDIRSLPADKLPRISLITPCFNHAEFIEETIQSVLSQGYPNLEYIVLDGGSTDGSVDIIRKYESHFSHWESEKDGGYNYALIKGFNRAGGDIFCWLNSDDLFEPDTLWEVAEYFMTHPRSEVVYGDGLLIDRRGVPYRPKKEHAFNRFIWLYDYNFIPQPSTFWRAGLYRRVGGLDPRMKVSTDADLWIRFADVTALHHVRRVWSRIRIYKEQLNQRRRDESNAEDEMIRRRYIGVQSRPRRLIMKVFAKSWRVTWKAVTGCYFM